VFARNLYSCPLSFIIANRTLIHAKRKKHKMMKQ